MADRSDLGWDTVAEYEADPIDSDSDDGKKIRQAENRALTKRKTKTSNKLTLRVPRQKLFGQQFQIYGEHNVFTPPSQRNLNLRFPSSSYYHIDIFESYQKFLGFSWYLKVTKFFVFTVLPFGLTSAPFIFPKVVRPLSNMRFNSVKITCFLDDGIRYRY